MEYSDFIPIFWFSNFVQCTAMFAVVVFIQYADNFVGDLEYLSLTDIYAGPWLNDIKILTNRTVPAYRQLVARIIKSSWPAKYARCS